MMIGSIMFENNLSFTDLVRGENLIAMLLTSWESIVE